MSKRTMERRYAPTTFEVREAADGTVGFRGYAAVFNQVAYGEVIREGAFDKTLAENPDVRMLVNHQGVPIARTKSGTLRLSVDARGLLAEVDGLDLANPTVQELVSAMRRGDIDQMSFAFYPMLDRSTDGVRELLEVKIDDGDVSVVTVPWYDETTAELNSLERAFSDLSAGRALTPECRSALLARIDSPAVEDRGQAIARALASAEQRDLNGWTFDALWPLLDEAVEDQMEMLHPERPYIWGYVCDVSDTWLVYWQSGDGCFQCDYTVTAEGVVTLGDPQPVIWKITYLPAPVDPDDDLAEQDAGGMSADDIESYLKLPSSELRRLATTR